MVQDRQAKLSQPTYSIKAERDVYVPMRDGVRLAINVFRPDAPGKFPGLVALSPYVKDHQDCYWLPPQSTHSPLWDGSIEAGDTKHFVSRGYVHIIADQRATGKSEGDDPNGNPRGVGGDGYDLIEWAAKQPWCDGNVGMTGYSAYATAQFQTAVEQPPHLKAIFFTGSGPDAYRGPYYTGGILCLFLRGLEKTVGTSGMCHREYTPSSMKTMPKEEFEQRLQSALNNRDIKYNPNAYQILHFPYKNPSFFDAMLQPFDGPFYWKLSPYKLADKVKVPVYIVAPWGHFYMPIGVFKLFEALKVPKKIMFTPERHDSRPWRTAIDVHMRWYDHWLKGIDTGIMEEPPISLFIPGSNQWQYEKEWPLPQTKWTKFYLRFGEGLSTQPEEYSDEPDAFLQQPVHLSLKRDSVQYLTPPLAEDLKVIGPGALYFHASIDQEDTNWIVKLLDVNEKDEEVLSLGTHYLKASHRAVDPTQSKPYAPWHPHTQEAFQRIQPGEIYEYAIELLPLGNVFKAGHRIKLEIYSMEHAKDPDMLLHYHPHVCSSLTTVHKIYRDLKYQSHLLLPVIPK
jgi:uncharacterized protein